MIISAKVLFLIITSIGIAIILYPQPTKAEVATSNDWIGMFPVGVGDNQSDTVGGNSWKSTGNTPADCLSSLPSGRPWLAGGCNFTTPPASAPGAYEFRLYANWRTDNTLTDMLAQSKPFWIPFNINAPTCNYVLNQAYVDLSWPVLAGINPSNPLTDNYRIYRNGAYLDISYTNSYQDAVTSDLTYTYDVWAYNSRGSLKSQNTVSITPNSVNCSGEVLPAPTPTVGFTSPPPPTLISTGIDTYCVNAPSYSDSEITISWTNPAIPVSWADISSDLGFGTYWNKDVSGFTSTFAPTGFSSSPALQTNTTYYVRLYNGVHSPTVSFNVPACPAPPAPVASSMSANCPSPGTIATFVWSPSDYATSYNIRIGTGGYPSDCGGGNICTNGITATTYNYSPTVVNTTYYWNLQASGPGGNSVWTNAPSSFTCTYKSWLKTSSGDVHSNQ